MTREDAEMTEILDRNEPVEEGIMSDDKHPNVGDISMRRDFRGFGFGLPMTCVPFGYPPPELPWIEKYRPDSIEDVVGNDEAVRRLKELSSKGIPNLLLTGPPGTGKTTSVKCIARRLLGEYYKDAMLDVNASDDSGMESVGEIAAFASAMVRLPEKRHKIIILDESDHMTKDAQQALVRLMTLYRDTTRFALACNSESAILPQVQSLCTVVRFSAVADSVILGRLRHVAEKEGVSFDEAGLEMLVYVAEGDLRSALNGLQSVHDGLGRVTPEAVCKIFDRPPFLDVREIVDLCNRGKFTEASIGAMILDEKGYDPRDVLEEISRTVENHPTLPELSKLLFQQEIVELRRRYRVMNLTSLQIGGLLARMCSASVSIA